MMMMMVWKLDQLFVEHYGQCSVLMYRYYCPSQAAWDVGMHGVISKKCQLEIVK